MYEMLMGKIDLSICGVFSCLVFVSFLKEIEKSSSTDEIFSFYLKGNSFEEQSFWSLYRCYC